VEDKDTLCEIFASINVETLILSIHNSYIFPKKVLLNKNLKIINFHNSLLPNHPGRNAPTWAIYEMDSKSGITWHEVIREIDKGRIVTQKSVTINSKMTGFDLTMECVRLGFESFKEIFPLIVSQEYTPTKQANSDLVKMHYSYETPNNGILDASWDVRQMSAFLRSIDYGVYSIFEKPRILLNDEWFKIHKYSLLSHPIDEIRENNKEELYFSNEELVIKLLIKPL
jgi:methionyl-tRNA formyltransferase